MKLLVVTQVVDMHDPVLGFFHRWIEVLAPHFEHIETVCLKAGKYGLPTNVRVHSLGKERAQAHRLTYSLKFLILAWKLRDEYDTVFVHMNQEYILIAGWLWKLLGKRVYMWRNHYAGSLFTDAAAAFCEKTFCTSQHSYTAKYKKNIVMPVGVDTERFYSDTRVTRATRSILFFGRIAESKRPGLVIDALIMLGKHGVEFTASFVGSPLPKDESYLAALKQRIADAGLMHRVTFLPGIPNEEAPDLYRAHQIYVNASPSGMYDKTIFEAAASGCVVLASSEDWRALTSETRWFSDSLSLSNRLNRLMVTSSQELSSLRQTEQQAVERHSLAALSDALRKAILS